MALRIGTTFSPQHLEYLNLDVDNSLTRAISFGFFHLRIGAYWNRIERLKGTYDYSELETILEKCERKNQKIIMVVGVKSPRWPEFYWPSFIKTKNTNDPDTKQTILEFVKKTIESLKKFSCITHWQVENEPLDPSGPENLSIDIEFLKKEIHAVKDIDPRPVIVSLWGNDMKKRGTFAKAQVLGDVVGLDLYYRQFVRRLFNKSYYRGPDLTDDDLRALLNKSKKPVWITELQAEPWEGNTAGYLGERPASMSPLLLRDNVERVSKLPAREVLLWGLEYWLLRQSKGDERYVDVVKQILTGGKKATKTRI